MDSPLQTYELGRFVQCLNDECRAHGKTVFKMVRISRMVDHYTELWKCSACSTKGVKKIYSEEL